MSMQKCINMFNSKKSTFLEYKVSQFMFVGTYVSYKLYVLVEYLKT